MSAADVAAIRALIEEYPQTSRRRLSGLSCERWNWRQENGALLYDRTELPAAVAAGPLAHLGHRCSAGN